jgi:hypothetical protein
VRDFAFDAGGGNRDDEGCESGKDQQSETTEHGQPGFQRSAL